MTSITVNASRTYEVRIGPDLLVQTGALSAPLLSGRQAVIVSDSNVWPLYGQTVQDSLERAEFRVDSFVFPAGETSKSTQTLVELLTFLAQTGLTRSDAVFALGGGVTGDMAGLAAALYLRGIPCIQLPTSLLAAVDSSVGGKTAVDLPEGKNLVGTFTQPHLVLCDTDVLNTLPPAVYAEGWAEIIKYGMIGSKALLNVLQNDPAAVDMEWIIAHCVSIKRDVVAADERDNDVRQLLNFGHTIGHAIERCGNYSIYHGEGVAMGMAIMTRACVRMGKCPPECWQVLEALLDQYHLPKTCGIKAEDLLKASGTDKKRRGETITIIQPSELGTCTLRQTNDQELAQVLALGEA
ncbi:MAG: 3-dehydroquinate synthase [Lawsonibacter sp.]|nr:3-dehydroquinate synthase [Lawsonibacter sp.]